MIRVRPKRFSSGAVKKLHTRGVGPFKVLKQIGSNAYVVDLPPDYDISSTFNVSDLVAYQDPAVIPSDPFEPSSPLESDPITECPPLALIPVRREQIDNILDEQVGTSRERAYHYYLMH